MKDKILIVEDELIIATYIQHILTKQGYSVTGRVVSAMEAISSIKHNKPDLVLVDIVIDGAMNGIELVTYIKSHFAIPCVFASANSDMHILEEALKVDPDGYVKKPLNNMRLSKVIDTVLHHPL